MADFTNHGTAAFDIGRDRIFYFPAEGASSRIIELCILGNVMSFWLELNGLAAIHASSVVIRGKAVCFCRGTAPGKSTTALELLSRGYSLFTDDILPLGEVDGRPTGYPGYPQIRLWPEVAKRYIDNAAALETVHPGYKKVRVDRDAGGFEMYGHPLRIGAIYLLDDGAASFCVEPMDPVNSLLTLIGNSFVAELVEAAGMQPSRLQALARLSRGIRFRRLTGCRGYGLLPDLVDAVLEDFTQLQNRK